MGTSLSDTQDESRTRTDENTDVNSATTSNGTTAPTFNSPQSQSILTSLTGQNQAPLTFNSGGSSNNPNGTQTQDVNQASQTLGNTASTGSALPNYSANPYIAGILSSSDALADQQLSKGEAGIRAQDYGQGDVKSINDQGSYAGTFANQQALNDANIKLSQYNTDNSNANSAANSLGSLGQNQQGLAAQILALLRGTATTGATTGESQTAASGTSSTVGHSDTGKVSYGASG